MTTKVNGAAYPGIWIERKVAFVKMVFSKDIADLADTDLFVLGTTTPVAAGTTGSSVFGVVESAVVQALKTLQTKATVLGVSKYDATARSIDVMLGHAEGWFSGSNGVIASGLPVVNAQALASTGELVSVGNSAVTLTLEFATFDGKMTVGTLANGALSLGVGATSGAEPINSPTGTAGYYPGSI